MMLPYRGRSMTYRTASRCVGLEKLFEKLGWEFQHQFCPNDFQPHRLIVRIPRGADLPEEAHFSHWRTP